MRRTTSSGLSASGGHERALLSRERAGREGRKTPESRSSKARRVRSARLPPPRASHRPQPRIRSRPRVQYEIQEGPVRVDPAHLRTIIAELESIRSHALRLEREHEPAIAAGGESARNLVHYLALRDGDRGALQTALARLGLSSLERAEPHVLATIDSVLVSLYRLAGREAPRFEVGEPKPRAFVEGGRRLERRADELFGPRVPSKSDSGRVRIMVTMPTAAAVSYELVRDLVLGGMDCMRINCAHDTPVEWAAMA